MFRIYADETLIYDSTLDDYKIGKGQISLETNRSGSFVFSILPDHPFYDHFVKLRTVIKVTRSGKIVFRGRVLSEVVDYWLTKTLTCEGELGFFNDSITRPFKFNGSVADFLTKLVNDHNSQVDEFKRFKIGTISVTPNLVINRYSSIYSPTLSALTQRLIDSPLGGYFYLTHGDDDTDDIPTIHYVEKFDKTASQVIEFGSNLRDYTRTVNAENLATAVIPIGGDVVDQIIVDEQGNVTSETYKPLTLNIWNGGKDYLFDPVAVDLYGWIFTTTKHETKLEYELLEYGKQDLKRIVSQNITIELTAIDLHLLDRSIESFNLNDNIRVISKPHNYDSKLLCSKLTIDLLNPENDTLTLGYTYSSFTDTTNKLEQTSNDVEQIQSEVSNVSDTLGSIDRQVAAIAKTTPVVGVSPTKTVSAGTLSHFQVTFPTPFKEAPKAVLVSLYAYTGLTIGQVVVMSVTKNGFSVNLKNTGSGTMDYNVVYAAYPAEG